MSSLLRTIARSRSQITFLKEGDANTKLLHAHDRRRKQRNFVAKLVDNDQFLTSHDDKEKVVYDFYNNLLGLCVDREHTISLDELNVNSHDLAFTNRFLEKRFGKQFANCLWIELLDPMVSQTVL